MTVRADRCFLDTGRDSTAMNALLEHGGDVLMATSARLLNSQPMNPARRILRTMQVVRAVTIAAHRSVEISTRERRAMNGVIV